MARKRNSERFGAPTPENTGSPAVAATTSEGMFSFVAPTDFVDLPSKGRFYDENHPLADIDTVEIRHMTAKEEDILTSESLLKKGLAIDRLLESILLNKNIKADSLLIGDKNALLIAARITGYGPLYDTTVRCPSCREVNSKVFNLEEVDCHDASEIPENVEMSDTGTFVFALPKSQVDVEVRLLTSRDERMLSESNEKKKKLKLPDTRSTDLLKLVIVSVNTHTDPSQVGQFIEQMPLQDVKYLRTIYEKVKPDVDIAYDFACNHCSHDGEVTMPLTAQFFWPNT